MFVLINFLLVLPGTQKMTNETYGNQRIGGLCLYCNASSEFDLYEYYLLQYYTFCLNNFTQFYTIYINNFIYSRIIYCNHSIIL